MKKDELEIVYQKYYKSLFLYAFSLTKNKEDAEDLVANTFVKAFLSFEEGNMKSWLYLVLRNEFYTMYKKRKHMIHIDVDILESTDNIIQRFFHQEQKRWLYKQIYALPDRERNIMLLSLQSQLDDQTISQMLNISIDNVRVIKHRVKKKLIDLCQKEGYL